MVVGLLFNLLIFMIFCCFFVFYLILKLPYLNCSYLSFFVRTNKGRLMIMVRFNGYFLNNQNFLEINLMNNKSSDNFDCEY